MFHVTCRLFDLRKERDIDVLEVESYKYDSETRTDRVCIRIMPVTDKSKAVEMLVDANELIQAIDNAVSNESSEKIRERRIAKRCDQMWEDK